MPQGFFDRGGEEWEGFEVFSEWVGCAGQAIWRVYFGLEKGKQVGLVEEMPIMV